jgi:hypothetical protein
VWQARRLRRLDAGLRWVVGGAVLAYLGWLVPHAWLELNEDYAYAGLFRQHRSPYPLPDDAGWVIDPRPGDLDAELSARYFGGRPLPPLAAPTLEGWRARFAALGQPTAPIEARAPADSEAAAHFTPRLVLRPEGPRLVVGRYEGQWVAFEPTVGVLLVREVALAEAPALALIGAREPRF